MSIAGADEVSEVLDRVKVWSVPSRIVLARRIPETLERSGVGEIGHGPPAAATMRGVPVEAVVGLLRTDREPPSDEQYRQIVEEERWRKYGP